MKSFKKIHLDKASYQGVTNFRCPECDYSFIGHDGEHVIGWGTNIIYGHCLIFECPSCFTKSFCHCGEEGVETYRLAWEFESAIEAAEKEEL